MNTSNEEASTQMTSKAWYRDASEEREWEPHLTDPPEYIPIDQLYKSTGVKYEKFSEEMCDDQDALERFPSDRKYAYHDYIALNKETNRKYYGEHLHDDPEIRLVIEGGGYFEVRSVDDRWVRINVAKGDMLDLPPGIWHRFALDKGNHCKMLRLFSETPVWKADFRKDIENPPARERYRATMAALA